MLRALWFAVKVGLLVTASVWVADHPGYVGIDWLGYKVHVHVGLVLLGLLFILAAAVFFYRVAWNIISVPKVLRRYRAERRKEKGFRALTLGLTAVAAGDAKLASYQAYRVRKFMPSDKGLSVLLEAQAARLKGEDAQAQALFGRLLENSDTAFLGMRGMLVNALEDHDTAKALDLARRAHALHPRQPWVLRMLYELELRERNWESARKILGMAVKNGAVDRNRGQRDGVAIALQQADDALQAGQQSAAFARMKQAHKMDPSFIPAAIRLARYYIDRGKNRNAAAVIEKTWKDKPHPELAALWTDSMPKKAAADPAARLRWFEKLVALNPGSVEGQMAAGEEALDQNLWGTARQYFDRAGDLRPNVRLFRLRARLAQAQSRPEEMTLMLKRAAEAPPDKAWICRETGRTYEHWSPVAQPHGSFNTIVWDYPEARFHDSAIADRTALMISAPG